MTPRSIRRAAERKAEKAARKAERHQTIAAPAIPSDEEFQMSPAERRLWDERREALAAHRVAANRANAQLSTGPTTETGKRISSLNAVKTGLTGQTVLLPTDDAIRYQQHIKRFIADFKPATERESELVQSLADTQWRLARIPGLEMAIFAKGRLEFADQFAQYDDATAIALIDAEILVKYHKQLTNLARQEARLRNQFKKDFAELLEMQKERAENAITTATQKQNGFEFANATGAVIESTHSTRETALSVQKTSMAA